jgi:hypothetical protein
MMRKITIYTAEGLILLGVVFAVNANLIISAYYLSLKMLDKIKGLL